MRLHQSGEVDQDRFGSRRKPDTRDAEYQAAHLVDLEARHRFTLTPGLRYYYNRFNQDQTGPTCVANTATHILGDGPRVWPLRWLDTLSDRRVLTDSLGVSLGGVTGYKSPYSGQSGFRGVLYDQAQEVDEWDDTPPAGGTSFRAAAKVLKRWGLINQYLWLQDEGEVSLAIRNFGPVALGCNWYQGMYENIADGQRVYPTGSIVGGHEVALDGHNANTGLYRIQTWGIHLWIDRDALTMLLSDGDCCLITEVV